MGDPEGGGPRPVGDTVDTDLFDRPDTTSGGSAVVACDVEPVLPPRAQKAPARTADGHLVAPDPEVGDVVVGYQLEALLGRGGAGSVFRATSPDGATVALKVLAAAKVKRARVVQRFFDEVRAASLVEHDGLIRVLGFIEEESPRRLAYAMEYAEGEMLRARLERETALDLRLAIRIAIQICEALGALHDAGIVHRDLKPENILLAAHGPDAPPRVKLLDFGVVKFLPVDRTQGLAAGKPGTFVGTPRYMAPEQAAGAPVDARSDLFSVGVMLFEMITGRCPHEGDSLRDVVLAKLKGAPRLTVNPEKEILPHELTEVVDGCLQLKPSARPGDARKLASALSEAETVLFAVGAMRFGDGGKTVREESAVSRGEPTSGSARAPVAEGAPVRPTPMEPPGEGRGDVSVVGVRPGSYRPGASVVSRSQSAAAPPPAPAPGPAPTRAGPGRMIYFLVGLAMLAAALVIALAARRLTTEAEEILVSPGVEAAEEAREAHPR